MKFIQVNYIFYFNFLDCSKCNVKIDHPIKIISVSPLKDNNGQIIDYVCFFQNRSPNFIDIIEIKKISSKSLSLYFGHCVEAGCYVLNKKAAFNLILKSTPMIMPLDYYYNRSFEMDLKFTGIEPRIVRQNFGQSEISLTKSKIKKFTDKKKKNNKLMFSKR